MNRRDLITSAGVAGFFSGLAGCSALTGSTGSTNTPTANETAVGPKTDTTTPTADVQAAIEETRFELAAAFEVIHSMEFHRGEKLVANSGKFEQYDHEKALAHVEKTQDSLATVEQYAENQGLKFRYAVLAGLARVAREGAKLYNALRKAFLKGWKYEYAFERAYYKEAVERIGEGRTFLAELHTHRKEVAEALMSIGKAPVTPEVENFDYELWSSIEASIKKQTPALSATFKGFEAYTEAIIFDNQGTDALDDDEPKAAYNSFQKAINKVNNSKASLGKAKQREAIFFRSRLDAFRCRASGMKQAYTFHLQAADALAEGDEEESTDLRKKGTDKIGEAVDTCPED